MKISSPAFHDHESIPSRHTCDGADISPPLTIRDVRSDAKSLALIMDDPDVPPAVRADRNWDHWIVWNLPPTLTGIAEGATPDGVVGRNSWGRNAYGGPAPPDREHRYFFKLFALDTRLDLPPTATKPALLEAMKGHVLEEAQLVGRYERIALRQPV